MLVWYSTPGGSMFIPGTHERVYGYLYKHPPKDIPYEIYEKYKNCFIDAPYTSKWLRDNFGDPIEDISFTFSELHFLPHEALRIIARNMKIDFGNSKGRPSRRKILRSIKTKLRSM